MSRRGLLTLACGAAAGGLLSACGHPMTTPSSDMKGDMKSPDLMPVPECTIDSFTVANADSLQVGGVLVLPSEQTIVYREAAGFVTMWSACRHAGNPIAYNMAAGSLDCTFNAPPHGSRYKLDGTVLQGPATLPLLQRPACRQNGLLTISRSQNWAPTSQRTK